MSRFVPTANMSIDQIIECGYDAMAIVSLCATAARHLSEYESNKPLAGDVARALDIAGELIATLHDTVDIHEAALNKVASQRKKSTG